MHTTVVVQKHTAFPLAMSTVHVIDSQSTPVFIPCVHHHLRPSSFLYLKLPNEVTAHILKWNL